MRARERKKKQMHANMHKQNLEETENIKGLWGYYASVFAAASASAFGPKIASKFG